MTLVAALLAGAAFPAEKTVTLSVDNMTCATCPPIVKKSLTRVEGVRAVEVSLATNTATVTYDDAQAEVSTLIEATTNAGYPSRLAD